MAAAGIFGNTGSKAGFCQRGSGVCLAAFGRLGSWNGEFDSYLTGGCDLWKWICLCLQYGRGSFELACNGAIAQDEVFWCGRHQCGRRCVPQHRTASCGDIGIRECFFGKFASLFDAFGDGDRCLRWSGGDMDVKVSATEQDNRIKRKANAFRVVIMVKR